MFTSWGNLSRKFTLANCCELPKQILNKLIKQTKNYITPVCSLIFLEVHWGLKCFCLYYENQRGLVLFWTPLTLTAKNTSNILQKNLILCSAEKICPWNMNADVSQCFVYPMKVRGVQSCFGLHWVWLSLFKQTAETFFSEYLVLCRREKDLHVWNNIRMINNAKKKNL